jgi:hypothetical protein
MITLHFKADNQKLVLLDPTDYAIQVVDYIEAQFELGEGWDGFDYVRAVWTNGELTVPVTLTDGVCKVPWEVLTKRYPVKVNLVGSKLEDGEVSYRLTTEQITALPPGKNALVNGTEETEATPTVFEEFVAQVKGYSESAEASAQRAEQVADEIAQYDFHIDNRGHLIWEDN